MILVRDEFQCKMGGAHLADPGHVPARQAISVALLNLEIETGYSDQLQSWSHPNQQA